MIKGRLIVCIGSSWDYDPTSKHQIMKILSAHNDILWINYRGSRRPEINSADLKDTWTVLRSVARGLHQVDPSIVQFVPFTGNLNFPAPIPNDPNIKGFDVFTQFAVDDPTRAMFATTQGGLLHLQ